MNWDIHLYMNIFIVYYYKPLLGYVADILAAAVLIMNNFSHNTNVKSFYFICYIIYICYPTPIHISKIQQIPQNDLLVCGKRNMKICAVITDDENEWD